jgi:hypothetical protein
LPAERAGGRSRSGDLVVDAARFENCKAWSGGISLMNLARGGEGGAIYVAAGATLEVTDSTFAANAAAQGEIGPDGTTAGPGGRGGAIATAGAAVVRRSTFSANLAGKGGSPNGAGGAGGAIAVLGTAGSLLLEDSTFAANRSGDGNDVAFGEGADGAGGALDLEDDATLNNVTVSGNFLGTSATAGTAAVGGGIVVAGGTARLRNVTIASNSASGAGGGLARTGGTVVLRNSILSDNASSGTTSEDCTTNAVGSFQSEGYNRVEVSTGCASSLVGTDQVGAAANLAALADNGGPTQTRALRSTSPAIAAGDPAGCAAWDPAGAADVPLAADQRGEPRPVDGDGDLDALCDAGAYEAPEPPRHALAVLLAGSGAGAVTSSPAGIDCPGDRGEEYFETQQVELFEAADPGSVFAGWSGDCAGSGSCTVAMSQDRNVTATFALLRTLTVTLAGDGSGTVSSDPAGIDCGSDCDQAYADGASVALAAAADPESLFGGWSGDCPGATCHLTMDADRAVTATFLPRLVFASGFASGFDGWSGVVG